MKRQTVLFILLFFASGFILKAQQLNGHFPSGYYTGRLGGSERIPVECNIDEQTVHFKIRFGYMFDPEQEDNKPYEFFTGYQLRNDTLYFNRHNDTVPYLVYYKPEQTLSDTGGNLQLKIYLSDMFEMYHLRIHAPTGEREVGRGEASLFGDNIFRFAVMNCKANAGDTVFVMTSLGNFGFPVPAGADTLFFTPNTPEFGFKYACKGESVNELILKTGFYADESPVFYIGDVDEKNLERMKEYVSFPEHKVFIEPCVIETDVQIGYQQVQEGYTDGNTVDGSSMREDTIIYTASYKEAVETAKEKNLFIRVLYMENTPCIEKYLQKIRAINRETDYMYEDTYRQLKSFVLLFADKKEQKQMERLGVNKSDADFIVSADGHLLSQKELICPENDYDVSFFTGKEKWLITELLLIYLDKTVTPMLLRSPDDATVQKQYLDVISDILQSIGSSSYYYSFSWSAFFNLQAYDPDKITADMIPSEECIFSCLDRYAGAKLNEPADTSLIKMIISFYNKIYSYRPDVGVNTYSMQYLIKHAGLTSNLQSDYTLKTTYDIVFGLLTGPFADTPYSQQDLLQRYKGVIELMPGYDDYFYIHSSKYLNLKSVSPDFYKELISFYKGYLTRVSAYVGQDNYKDKLKESVEKFENSHYSDRKIYEPEELYNMLVRLAWLIIIHEGTDSENGKMALHLAGVAGEKSFSSYNYVTANYASLLYFTGQKERAVSVMRAYCREDRANSLLGYDQEMMCILKEMVLDMYEPELIY